jgi:hypothetical protein
MSLLKKIPITYIGELHQVKLVNFWVDMDEVITQVPKGIRVRDFGGKALVSLVNVELKNMHPSFLPGAIHFGYRHVAFRLLVDDAKRNGNQAKGIYFLRSFTDRAEIVAGGNLLTDYRLEKAEIRHLDRMMGLYAEGNYFNYALDLSNAPVPDIAQKEIIGSLDRAYAMEDGHLKMVKIMREKWPIRQVQCYLVETNFFKTARPASAFVVDEVIHYRWTAAKNLGVCEL